MEFVAIRKRTKEVLYGPGKPTIALFIASDSAFTKGEDMELIPVKDYVYCQMDDVELQLFTKHFWFYTARS
jgi:hypothetical protein